MENEDLENNNNLEDLNSLDNIENSSKSQDLNQEDIKKGVSNNQLSSSLKRSNKDIRVYTMPEEFFNKKYQISRAKRLVDIRKEQDIMEDKRIIEEKKRMKRIDKESRKAEKQKIKKQKVEIVNAEKLKKEYEKRQELIENNRKEREEILKKEEEKRTKLLKKEQELVLKKLEKKKLKEIKKEKEIDKRELSQEKKIISEEKKENILNSSILDNKNAEKSENVENTEKENDISLKEKIGLKFDLNRKKSFSDNFSDTIDGDVADSDIKKNVDKQIVDSIGNINEKDKNKKKDKKDNNFLFIFISIIVFVISVIITILITYRNGEWFYYEEEIDANSNNSIYWEDLIEEENIVEEKELDTTNENEENNLFEDSENNEDLEDNEKELDTTNENEENNELKISYYEKCNFFITDVDFNIPIDSDSDCLTDKEEVFYGTLDNNSDSDSDSYLDGLEVAYVYDPLTSGKIYNNKNLKEYKDEVNKFSFYYPKSFEFKTIDGNIFRILPDKDSYEYFEVELLGKFDLSSLGRIKKSIKIEQIPAWVSDSSEYVYFKLSNEDVLRVYYNFENIYSDSNQSSLSYQASFSLIVRSVYIW
jgi:hypothetical protein